MSPSPIPLLFCCGERSRWGLAHLAPLLASPDLRVVGIVLATEARWAHFRRALTGEPPAPPPLAMRARATAKALLGRPTLTAADGVVREAAARGIPLWYCDDANAPAARERFREGGAELLFSAAYPQLFAASVLEGWARGAYNSHPSLLPRCRGAHPVFWTIASGERRAGGTIHRMTTALDQGEVVAQVEVPFGPDDRYRELYASLETGVPALVARFGRWLQTPGAPVVVQDEGEATTFRNDRQIHRRLFWQTMSAEALHNLIRAADGDAFCWVGGRKLLVGRAALEATNRNLTNGIEPPPGTVVDLKGGPVVVAAGGLLRLLEVRAADGQGLRLDVGMIFS